MKKAFVKKISAVAMATAITVGTVGVGTLAQVQPAQAATNGAATSAINSLKGQTGFRPGSCGWTSWRNPYPSGWTNCKAGCWFFVANAEQRLVGTYPSGPNAYTLTNPGAFAKVGVITDSAKANPSYNGLQALMKKAYPGDVIQFKGGPRGWGSYQHTAIVESVDGNGVRIYQHGDSAHVSSTYYNWSSFYNSYLDFDAWTSWTKGITLYHYKSYGSRFGGGSSVSSSTSKPVLSGASYPTTLTKGKCFGVTGSISSSSKITYVSAAVYNGSGKWVTGGTARPNTTNYNLANLDNYVRYNILGAGTYTYKVVATNASGTHTLLSKSFRVVSKQAGPTIAGANYPTSIKKGKCFGLSGTVYGNGSNLTKVTAAVYTTRGSFKTGKTLSVNTGSVSIARSLDAYVHFNWLSRGTYVYKVIATNSAGTHTLLSRQFRVY